MDRPSPDARAIVHGLSGYVHEVAAAVGVGNEGVTFEVSDTATAYLGLSRRLPAEPDRDLMLVWSERHGWAIAPEPGPGEPIEVAAYFGEDLVPPPSAVAGFVADVVGARHRKGARPRFAADEDRTRLRRRLAGYSTHQQ